MKVYKVKVNGKVYEVELEAVEENNETIKVENTNSAPTSNTVAPSSGDKVIVAPIAGKVLDVKVSVGDKVQSGQTVMLIEAMKLENEIQSSFDGVVKQINVSKGNDVRNKDVLIVLE